MSRPGTAGIGLGVGREPLVNGEEGRKSLERMLAIYESSRTGEAVRLPLTRGVN